MAGINSILKYVDISNNLVDMTDLKNTNVFTAHEANSLIRLNQDSPDIPSTDALFINVRAEWHDVFINTLESIAKRSRCVKIQTAALIALDSQILAIGYNGTFSKHTECCDYWLNVYNKQHTGIFDKQQFIDWLYSDKIRSAHREWSTANEIHAEANALTWINKRDITDKHIMYTLYSPCSACAKAIMSYGIKTVYYKHIYTRGHDALTLLKKSGVTCIHRM